MWPVSYALLRWTPAVEKKVVALAPTDVVWEGQHERDDDPRRSKWTWRGEPVPFLPLDRSWRPESTPPAFAPCYAESRQQADPATVDGLAGDPRGVPNRRSDIMSIIGVSLVVVRPSPVP
jgi:hypothetical protein